MTPLVALGIWVAGFLLTGFFGVNSLFPEGLPAREAWARLGALILWPIMLPLLVLGVLLLSLWHCARAIPRWFMALAAFTMKIEDSNE